MITIQLATVEATLFLNVDDPATPAALIIEAEPVIVARVKDMVNRSTGLYGHYVDVEAITAPDLWAVCQNSRFRGYIPVLQEGEDILARHRSRLPGGAQT